MGLASCGMVQVVMVERALRPVCIGAASSGTAKGAHGNAAEELFGLLLLLCSLCPCGTGEHSTSASHSVWGGGPRGPR